MFSLRLYFHLHNSRKNSAFLKEMQKRTEENIYLGLHGKLMCGQKGNDVKFEVICTVTHFHYSESIIFTVE